MKTKFIFLIFGIAILLVLFVFLISGKVTKLENKKGILPIKEITIENQTELSNIQKIESIAQYVAKSNTYKLNKFDCTDFTISLVGNLTKEGYNARCIIGYKKQNPKQILHAWTEVNLTYGGCSGTFPNKVCEEFISDDVIWIESTTGEIVSEENKFYYVPLKGYKRYQCF